MKVKILKSFKDKLNRQIEFIAQDKPEAARKFKNDLIIRIQKLPQMPYSNRKSIFFNREDVRDLIFKGYIIVYKIDIEKQYIYVFGFIKFEKNLKY